MRYGLVLLMLIAMPCRSQTTTTGRANTTGPCSPVVTGGNNQFRINCGSGITKEQGDALLKILNKILRDQLDPEAVMDSLKDIQKGLEKISGQQEISGLLSPADEPTPQNTCRQVPNGAMLVLLGNSASYGSHFPQTIIKIGDDRMLTLDKVEGKIAISVKLFSRDGRIVAEIDRNMFRINPNNYFRKELPDEHSLVIFDQEDVKVLDVRFVNPTTVRFLGVIRHPRSTVEISPTRGLFANTICTGEAGDAHFTFN